MPSALSSDGFTQARRFSELAVFYARLYVRVRRLDEPAERCGVCGRSRSQLHMAHELAGALQRAGRIRQRCAVKEPHVYVRTEYIDVAEGRIAQTYNRTAVMQDLPDFVPAFSLTSNHSCAMAPNSPACSFIHASMAGSRSTPPLNRSNSVLIIARLPLTEIIDEHNVGVTFVDL